MAVTNEAPSEEAASAQGPAHARPGNGPGFAKEKQTTAPFTLSRQRGSVEVRGGLEVKPGASARPVLGDSLRPEAESARGGHRRFEMDIVEVKA